MFTVTYTYYTILQGYARFNKITVYELYIILYTMRAMILLIILFYVICAILLRRKGVKHVYFT